MGAFNQTVRGSKDSQDINTGTESGPFNMSLHFDHIQVSDYAMAQTRFDLFRLGTVLHIRSYRAIITGWT